MWAPPPLLPPLLHMLAVLIALGVQQAVSCGHRPTTDVRRTLNPRSGRPACYLLPLQNYRNEIAETTRSFGTCKNSTITILVDGQFRCVQLPTGRLTRPADALTCPDDGAIYMYGLNHMVGTHMVARKIESASRFVCYQLQRPERDPLFWRTHLERTDMGFYYCKALYGFGTARVAIYLVADAHNVRRGFCFFAGRPSDVPRTVESRWCHLSVGGVVAFRAWKTQHRAGAAGPPVGLVH